MADGLSFFPSDTQKRMTSREAQQATSHRNTFSIVFTRRREKKNTQVEYRCANRDAHRGSVEREEEWEKKWTQQKDKEKREQ